MTVDEASKIADNLRDAYSTGCEHRERKACYGCYLDRLDGLADFAEDAIRFLIKANEELQRGQVL